MRKPTKQNLGEIYTLIYSLASYFNYTCEVCGRKMRKPMPGFTIHHLEYRKGEKTHKDFVSRIRYYQYLTNIIYKFIDEGVLHKYFAFLCNACHHSLDGPRGINRRKRINVLRLFLMWFRTNT